MDTNSFEPTNQNSIKVLKVIEPTKKTWLPALGTSEINSPISCLVFKSRLCCVTRKIIKLVTNVMSDLPWTNSTMQLIIKISGLSDKGFAIKWLAVWWVKAITIPIFVLIKKISVTTELVVLFFPRKVIISPKSFINTFPHPLAQQILLSNIELVVQSSSVLSFPQIIIRVNFVYHIC